MKLILLQKARASGLLEQELLPYGYKCKCTGWLSTRTMHHAQPLCFPRCRVLDQDLEPTWDQNSISRRFYWSRNMNVCRLPWIPTKDSHKEQLFLTQQLFFPNPDMFWLSSSDGLKVEVVFTSSQLVITCIELVDWLWAWK
ncbi:hypothetical protein Q9966_008890 [Columba livia]|nr:hypothetical protein Q9966_008890 [Columba livia]